MRSTTRSEDNIAAMAELVSDAAGAGATYVQTPEMTGFVQQNRKALFETVKTEADEPLLETASSLAQEHHIWLHIGSTAILRGDGMVANRAFVFSPQGNVAARYDKLHMFDVDLDNGESWRESAVYQPGDQAVICNVDGAKLGLGICYDVRFPELFKAYAQAGAEILTTPAAFTRQTGEAHWHTLLRSRAIENGAFVISAAQGGKHEDGRETFGHSLMVNPWGEVIAEVKGDEPGYAVAEIDVAQVHAARAKIPNLKNGQAFTLAHASDEDAEAAQ